METLTLTILKNCSNKSYTSLCEAYGKNNIDKMISENLIVNSNGIILKTEIGVKYSSPLKTGLQENFGDGYQLITDSIYNQDTLICS